MKDSKSPRKYSRRQNYQSSVLSSVKVTTLTPVKISGEGHYVMDIPGPTPERPVIVWRGEMEGLRTLSSYCNLGYVFIAYIPKVEIKKETTGAREIKPRKFARTVWLPIPMVSKKLKTNTSPTLFRLVIQVWFRLHIRCNHLRFDIGMELSGLISAFFSLFLICCLAI
ncbi:uncharacterized protein LOC144291874 [Canis aureus]